MSSEGQKYRDLFETGLGTWKIACMCDVDESRVYNLMNRIKNRAERMAPLPTMSPRERAHYEKLVRHLGMDRETAIGEVMKTREAA